MEIVAFEIEDVIATSSVPNAVLKNVGIKQTQLDVHTSPWDTNK